MADLSNIPSGGDGVAPDGMPGTQATGRPGGPPPNIQQLVASKRLQQAQAQVGEVVDIMRVNVEKVLERDQKISELDRRADDLQEGASQFQQQAVKLKRKYWWENTKMWLIIGVVLLVIIIIVVVSTTGQGTGTPSTVAVQDGESGQESNAGEESAQSDSGVNGIDKPDAGTQANGDATGDGTEPEPQTSTN